MKRWMAVLDTACAWINPGLVVVAIVLALLDAAAVVQRWTFSHPPTEVSVRTVVVAARSETCSPSLPPELRDMAGRD